MTPKQAQAEAVRRWGKNGAVESVNLKTPEGLRPRMSVGFVSMGMFFEVRGQGANFEEAFAQADEKAKSKSTGRAS